MKFTEDNQINYWGGSESYQYLSRKPERSIKKKLFIVFSFVFVLAVTPSLIYTLMNLDFSNERQISVVSTDIQTTQTIPENNAPEVHNVYIEEAKPAENEATVINNDSYWKITKRVCGQGNNYLIVKEENGGKALYEGDTVKVNCNL